jgi:hypothetical protein
MLTVHLSTIFVNNQFDFMFISILYVFRAAMCPSSGELIVLIRNLVYVTPYRRPFSVQVWIQNFMASIYAVKYRDKSVDIDQYADTKSKWGQ